MAMQTLITYDPDVMYHHAAVSAIQVADDLIEALQPKREGKSDAA